MNKDIFFENESRGAGAIEVLLTLAVVTIATPFVYNQISRTNEGISHMRIARDVMSMRAPAMNFVRLHQDKWPDVAQIKMAPEDIAEISEFPNAGFIDKYALRGVTVTDVYLAFDLSMPSVRVADIASRIGGDAALVGEDGVAYGDTWAVSAPDFKPGNLIYRISHDFAGQDTSRFLHRGTSGEDDLNQMQRDLNMGGYNVFDIGGVDAKSFKATDASASFITAEDLVSDSVYFSSGAIIDGATAEIDSMRVTGDVTGFRNITATKLNGDAYTTNGRIVTDRATVTGTINVSQNLNLKANSVRTISGFTAISAASVAAPFISTKEIIFYENFGLTLSGELLMSTTPPLKIGGWTFPSVNPPKFSSLTLTRAKMPATPDKNEFAVITGAGWKSVRPKNE